MANLNTCDVEGCSKQTHAKGLCDMHYQRLRKKGEVGPPHSLQTRRSEDGLSRDQRYHLRHLEESRKRHREYMARAREDPVVRARHNEGVKASYHRNKHKPENVQARRDYHLFRVYRMRAGDYDALLTLQNGTCALCPATPAQGRRLHVDHDHKTGRVRGLLCNRCNTALGHIDWMRERVGVIKKYLGENPW